MVRYRHSIAPDLVFVAPSYHCIKVMQQKESVLMNGLVMKGECREMQEFRCSDDDTLVTKNGSVDTSGEVDGGMTASDGDLERKGSSWRCYWREQCSRSRALSLRRHWFVGEVIHITRLAIPLVS